MKIKIFILFISLLSLFSFGYIEPKNSISNLNYISETFESKSFYSIGNFDVEISNNAIVGKFPITIKLVSSSYYAGIDYINNRNVETSFKEINLKQHISQSKRTYTLNFSIPLSYIGESSKITLYLNCPLLHHKLTISFTISNPKIRQNLNKNTKLFYKYNYANLSGKNYFYEIIPTSFISANKNYYYYDYFDFKDFYIENNLNKSLTTYLYIEDKSTLFLNAFSKLQGENTDKKFALLSSRNEGNKYYVSYQTPYYLIKKTNIMTKVVTNIEVDSKVYMPINYYEVYKKTKLGLMFLNIGDEKYSVDYSFTVTFEENYKKEENKIYKENGYVSKDDILEEIHL